MFRTVTTLYGPAHYNRKHVDHGLGRPIYRPWEYFDLDGRLNASNPIEAAKASLHKTLAFLLCVVLAAPVALYHPVAAVLVLAFIAFSLKANARRYGVWHGECPHCREELWIAGARRDEKEIDCRICGGSVLLRSGRFLAAFPQPDGRARASGRGFLPHFAFGHRLDQEHAEPALRSEMR